MGECKMTGGKLVRAVVETDKNQFSAVHFSGDFFIEPESAATSTLRSLEQALLGAPVDLPRPAVAARLRAAIPLGVECLGTTPEAMALAVQRAINPQAEQIEPPALERIGTLTDTAIHALTKAWKDFPWRIIPECPQSAAMNVALDEVFCDRLADQQIPPTLRFWRWSEPAVILGRCQSVVNEVDVQAADERGIRLVRRMTGGGAMFLQPYGAITYSIYLPETAVQGLSLRQSYEVCDAWVIQALRAVGVDAHHVPINDIACQDGKIGGAAQARRRGVVLHHTTMAYDMDPGDMLAVLRIGKEKLRDKGVASAAKRVSPLVRQSGLSREELVSQLLSQFQQNYGGVLSTLTDTELALARSLVATKYSTAAWTHEYE